MKNMHKTITILLSALLSIGLTSTSCQQDVKESSDNQSKKSEYIVDAVRLAWQAAGVRRVVNELKVDDGQGGVINYASDVIIANKMRWALLTDKYVTYINYTIEVNEAVIYIMGIGQDEQEVARVVNHAREISGVKRVVNHVRLRNDPSRVAK